VPPRVAIAQGVVDEIGEHLAQQSLISTHQYGMVRDRETEIDVALERAGNPLLAHPPRQRG